MKMTVRNVICICETKTDHADPVDITNYTAFCKHRFELSNRKSGGIIIYVRNEFAPYVTIVNNDCQHIL